MNNVHIVEVVECSADLSDSIGHVLLRKLLVLLEKGVECPFLHVLHQQVDVGLIREKAVKLDEVAVMEV